MRQRARNASGSKLRIARIVWAMAVVERSTPLEAPAGAVWAAVKTPVAFRDRIEIEAGIVTPVIVVYAWWFYRMRQRRWRAVAKGMS